MVLKTKLSKRVSGFVLIAIFIIPFNTLKFLSIIDSIKSTPCELTVINHLKLFSPLYYIDNNGNIINIFFTVKGIPVSRVFDIEGRTKSMIVINKDGNYGYVNFEYIKYSADVEINENTVKFDRDKFLTEMIGRNMFPITANYLSNLITLLLITLILYKITFYFWNRLRQQNPKI